MLLSIGLMVKNESKHLDKCLQSLMPILKDLEAELIIVDTGSTDNTVEIAKQYTDKVYHHEWFDDFAGMRNIVLGHATGEWFFYVDGDEVVEDASGIIRFFKSNQHRKFNAAFIDMKNPYSSKDLDGYGIFQALRFFRKDKDFHFKGIVHEQPQAKGPVARIEGTIIHYGYVSDDKKLMEYKFQRNVALINKILEKEPENIYHLFQLSQSYGMYGKSREALKPIEKAYHLAKARGLANYMNVVNQLASIYFNNGMYAECEAICQEGLKIKDGYMDLHYFKGMSQAELGKFQESIASFQRYLSLVRDYESGKGLIDFSIAHLTIRYNERAYATLCGLYKKLGDYRQALDYSAKVTTPQLLKRVIPNLVDIYTIQRDFQAIKELYEKWSHDENIMRTIENTVESKRIKMETEERRELAKIFADETSKYGLLNAARGYCIDKAHIISTEFWQKISEIDLSRSKVYYGDLVLLFIKYERPLAELLINVRNDRIATYFLFLFSSYRDFVDEFRACFSNQKIWQKNEDDIHVNRIKTAALYAALQQKALSDADYEYFFELYLDLGTKYVEECYNPMILDADVTSWARTGADEFLFLIRKAKSFDKASAEYVRYLRQALVQDESMKRGIEMLLQEFQEQSSGSQDELNALKKSIQDAIEKAINAGEFETAVTLINEYEDAVGQDAPICGFKGIVHMVAGELEQAESAFLIGIKLEPDNPDLLYNLGYVSESLGKYSAAIRFYESAINHAIEPELISDARTALSRCKALEGNNVQSTPKKLDLLEMSLRQKYKL